MFVIHPIERCDFFFASRSPALLRKCRIWASALQKYSWENERVEVKMRNGLTETKRVLVIQFAFVISFCHIFVLDYFNEMIHHHNRKNDQLKIYNWYILMEVFPVFFIQLFMVFTLSGLLFLFSSSKIPLLCSSVRSCFLFVVYTTNLQSGRLIDNSRLDWMHTVHEICIQLNCNENYHRIQSTLKLIETIQRTGYEIITASTFELKTMPRRNCAESECVRFEYTISSLKQNFILLFQRKKTPWINIWICSIVK